MLLLTILKHKRVIEGKFGRSYELSCQNTNQPKQKAEGALGGHARNSTPRSGSGE